MKKMLGEFREFAMRGDVADSLANDDIMPPKPSLHFVTGVIAISRAL